MNRFERLTAILLQLQARRTVNSAQLAAQLAVSTRTIYRDLRTLALAGLPLVAEAGVGYSLAEGYRLPPVMFTREEATALLTAEQLAVRLTDAPTAQLTRAAMDKLRAVLRRADRDYLAGLAPAIQVLGRGLPADQPPVYQQLVAAIATQQVVGLHYRAGAAEQASAREVEPVGLYLGQHWHLVAYCRLRHAVRDFRLDRIQALSGRPERFAARPAALAEFWAARTGPGQLTRVVLHVRPALLPPTLAQHLHDTKRQHGWAQEQELADGQLEMTLYLGSLSYLAAWLLPYAGAVTVVEPAELLTKLRALIQRAQEAFGAAP